MTTDRSEPACRRAWGRHPVAMILGVVALAVGGGATARAAEDVSDVELAALPIVVVGHVPAGPVEKRERRDRKALVARELRVPLVIDRVLAGKVAPGRTTLLLQDGLRVSDDGGPLWSSDLGEPHRDPPPDTPFLHGEVRSTRLWFLEQGRSVDPADSGTYLILRRARGWQRPELESWFMALRSPDAALKAPAFLEHADPSVAAAALAYVAGGRMPWPETSELVEAVGPERPAGAPLASEAARVRKLLPSKDPYLRRHAATVLHRLEGPACAESLRTLLDDPDGEVVVVAMALLGGLRDTKAFPALIRASLWLSSQMVSMGLALEAVAQLAGWDDPRVTSVLIGFLSGPDLSKAGITWSPGTYAQELLLRRTGYAFPMGRASACLAVWEEAAAKPPAGRVAFLTERLGVDHSPLVAALRADPSEPTGYLIEVKHRGTKPLTIPRRAGGWISHRGAGYAGVGGDISRRVEPTGSDAYVELKPGETLRLSVWLPPGFGRTVLKEDAVHLDYEDDGSAAGLATWQGGVWVALPEPSVLRRDPSEAERKELDATLQTILGHARARTDEAGSRHLAMVGYRGQRTWDGRLWFAGRGEAERAHEIMSRLRLALTHGGPVIERIDVSGGQGEPKRNGPFLDARVRFGAGATSQLLSLRFRRTEGELLLGVLQHY